MKKRSIRALAAAVSIAALIGLAACGGEKEDSTSASSSAASTLVTPEPTLPPAELAGSYEALRIEGEQGMTEEDLLLMRDMGMDITCELAADGTGTMDILGEPVEVTYDTKAMTMSLNGAETPFTYADGILTVPQATGDMVFQKKTGE